MIRKVLLLWLLLSFSITGIGFCAPVFPEISAKAAIVIEASTGKVLYAKNAEERRFPASTTKIMTLITALEAGNINDVVTAGPDVVTVEGSTLWLSAGEQLQMKDLLYGMMLVSGNDATVAIAEHISGSVDAFAKLMTQKAHNIGATNTNFVNTSGLPDNNHYTTAHDLAKLTSYGYKNPLFAQIVSEKHKTIPWAGKNYERDLYNENKMLWYYEGANGVKTGYTEAAGRCLVTGAKRGNLQLVVVVLDSDTMWTDSKNLLDYGFGSIEARQIYKQGDVVKTLHVSDGTNDSLQLALANEVVLPVSSNDSEQFSTVIEAPSKCQAPIAAGQTMGSLKILYKGEELSKVDLVATQAVERKSFFGKLWTSLWSVFTFVIQNFA